MKLIEYCVNCNWTINLKNKNKKRDSLSLRMCTFKFLIYSYIAKLLSKKTALIYTLPNIVWKFPFSQTLSVSIWQRTFNFRNLKGRNSHGCFNWYFFWQLLYSYIFAICFSFVNCWNIRGLLFYCFVLICEVSFYIEDNILRIFVT